MQTPSKPQIIAEDSRWLIVNKPSGWLSVPPSQSALEQRPDLKKWLIDQEKACFPVHRLDVETSGLILFAKDQPAHKEANGWFESRQVKKSYAFFAGPPADASWDPAGVAPVWRVQTPIAGKDSQTRIELQKVWPAARGFYAWAFPLTGRRHQIRIHLAQSGFPLWGDAAYGGSLAQFSRVALHARSLEFPVPVIGQKRWELALPADFQLLLEQLAGQG